MEHHAYGRQSGLPSWGSRGYVVTGNDVKIWLLLEVDGSV